MNDMWLLYSMVCATNEDMTYVIYFGKYWFLDEDVYEFKMRSYNEYYANEKIISMIIFTIRQISQLILMEKGGFYLR